MGGHRISTAWMGTRIETLADLLPPNPRAVVVGINPAPVSVAAGHYYQGRQGQRFFSRLVQAGVLPTGMASWEDDIAVELGIGFTDVVKRPTTGADEVSRDELRHGRDLLERRLNHLGNPPLIFPFKAAAVALVGKFDRNGWIDRKFAGCRLFVMPGPYQQRASSDAVVAALKAGL